MTLPKAPAVFNAAGAFVILAHKKEKISNWTWN
jgi:hypothetical protein